MPRSPISYYMQVSLKHMQPHAAARCRREFAAAMHQFEQSEQRMLELDALVKGIFQHMAGDVEIPGQMEVEQGSGIIRDARGRLVLRPWVKRGQLKLRPDPDNPLTKASSLAARFEKLFETGPSLSLFDLKDLPAPDLLELPAESSSDDDDDDDDQAAFWTEANLMALATMAKERAASLEKTRDYVRANCADALRR